MATISILNTSTNLSGKTVITAEADETITGLKTFSRGASAPFAVAVGGGNVANLDADKLDGLDSSVFARWDGGGTGQGQIKFPAVQSASSDANVLDDYEEGTWIPVIGGSGGTSGQVYATQVGHYVKVGKLVTATFNVALSTKGTITTDVQIQGLPFTIETGFPCPLIISLWTNMTATVSWMGGFGGANTTAATIYRMTAAGVSSVVSATADFSNSTQLVGQVVYRASA